MLFFLNRSEMPRGGVPDHSVSILVAPVIIAGRWLRTTADMTFFQKHPEVVADLKTIVDQVMKLKAPSETLFRTKYSSDGSVGRVYDYSTNLKVWYAFESLAYLLTRLDRQEEGAVFANTASEIKAAIEHHMVVEGPFGRQISGGTNLGEDPGTFYIDEQDLYYDGEDTGSMLAPIYGMTPHTDEPWKNYHRFARSLFCGTYDPEFDTLLWNAAEPMVIDGTALISRVGGSTSINEMKDAMLTLRKMGIDEVTGSLFWWPCGITEKRVLTRCSQGQGAWAWQYMEQWLGVKVKVWSAN
jgi:hypothetical protein